MHFDRGQSDGRDRVANGVCIVRIRSGIDHDPVVVAAGRVQFVDDRPFRIVLDATNCDAYFTCFAFAPFVEGSERRRTVNILLARPEQRQIWSVNDEYVHDAAFAEKAAPTSKRRCVPDRIITATAADGSFSIVAGITTELVGEAQRRNALAPTASAAVGRLLTGAALLGASLKGREKLSLQIASDGPLQRILADVALAPPGHGAVHEEIGGRAYTRHPHVDLPLNAQGKFDVGGAVGRGYLQATRSFEIGQPYVGIVELHNGEIGDDLAAYLMTSEQIPSVVALGVLANPQGIKAAGGAIAQVLPGADEAAIDGLEARARSMAAVTTQVDGGAGPLDLIASLAGPVAMRYTREYDVAFRCTCSRERVERALLGLGRDELHKMTTEQPQTEAVCEFCKTAFVVSHDEVRDLIERLASR